MTVNVDGKPFSLGPGPCPDWAVNYVTFPGVWADDGSDPSRITDSSESEPPVEVDVQPVVEVEKPQQRESKAVWLEYAHSQGIEIPEDATKAEVMEIVNVRERG